MPGHGENCRCHLRVWLQTAQERPFTTKIFREADCAIYIVDVTKDVQETTEKVQSQKTMLDIECRENFVHILAGNKIDLPQERKLTTIAGHEMARRLGMDRYVEICAIQNIEIRSTIEDLLLRGVDSLF